MAIDMKSEDLKLLIVSVIAIMALILAGMSLLIEDEVKKIPKTPNTPPISVINVASNLVEEMESVNFNGSVSTDLDGTIIEYTWDFDDRIKDSGMYSNHQYSNAGTYTVILTVVDNEGASDESTITITVLEGDGSDQNELPTAVIDVDTTTVEVWSLICFISRETYIYGIRQDDSGSYSNGLFSGSRLKTV